jgi:signal recognition particle receptor subunit beta
MAWKNKSEIKICIAVLGPEGAGKHTIIEQINNRILSQPPINHFDKEANRPSLKESKLPNKLDFKPYSDFNHFSLGHPEHYGLIVLNFPQVSDFSKSDALAQYFHFFESLHKLTWLGVDQYVVAITRMDWIHADSSKWFEQVSSWIKQRLYRFKGKWTD